MTRRKVTKENIIDNGDGTISCPLSKNKFTEDTHFIIDAASLPVVEGSAWSVDRVRGTRSLRNYYYVSNGTDRLHKLLIPDAKVVDHIDRSGNNWLNHSLSNLRLACLRTNSHNKRSGLNSSSPYLGVSWSTASNKWRARIKPGDKELWLGLYENEEDAAQAYDVAAREYYGEYANLNILEHKWDS